jgi:gluconokinase
MVRTTGHYFSAGWETLAILLTFNSMECILGIDIGTSSVKAIAFSLEGNILADASKSYPLLQPGPGLAEQDPDTILEAVLHSIGRVCFQVKNRHRVVGLSFSGAMHGIMALDAGGKPLTPIITWGDTRSIEASADLKKSPTALALYQATGTPNHPMSPLCKLRWLRNHLPETMHKARYFTGIKEYVIHHLTGKWVTDYSMASATGLFNIHTLEWHEPALEWAGITAGQLPAVFAPDHIVARGSDLFPKEWQVDEDCSVVLGATDGCLANLGSGVMEPGLLALTIGTSGAVRMTIPEPRPDRQGRTFNYRFFSDNCITGGPINNGGIVLKWFAEQILGKPFNRDEGFRWFLQEAAKAPTGAEGLICLPYFLGERAPIWNAAATGMLQGMHLRHNQTHMMRALVEGISFSLCQIAEILEQNTGSYSSIRVSGGFTSSETWVQWIADIFGRPVQVSQDMDASATGAAMLGWKATGRISAWKDLEAWVQVRQVFPPDAARSQEYREYYGKFTSLVEKQVLQ